MYRKEDDSGKRLNVTEVFNSLHRIQDGDANRSESRTVVMEILL